VGEEIGGFYIKNNWNYRIDTEDRQRYLFYYIGRTDGSPLFFIAGNPTIEEQAV